MGYFYDYVEQKWQPKDHTLRWTRARDRRVTRRSELIEDLLREIEVGRDSITTLYAGLLSRALVQTDEKLMAAYGKEVAEISVDK